MYEKDEVKEKHGKKHDITIKQTRVMSKGHNFSGIPGLMGCELGESEQRMSQETPDSSLPSDAKPAVHNCLVSGTNHQPTIIYGLSFEVSQEFPFRNPFASS